MSGPLLFVLFACLLGSVLSVDLDVELKGELKAGVVMQKVFHGNWETVGALTVKDNKKAVRVCVVETPSADFLLPNNTAYWNITCLYTHVFGGPTPPPVPVPVPAPEPVPVPVPVPAPEHVPVPAPEPVAPVPVPAPEPVAPVPVPAPEPVPVPVPAPEPVPVPAPEPVAPVPVPVPAPEPSPAKRSIQEDTQNVLLRDVQYTIGITLENPGKDDTDTFELALEGAICGSGEVYDAANMKCINATVIVNNAEITEAGSYYYKIEVGPLVGSLTVASTGANDMVYLRYAGSPSPTGNDAHGTGNARVDVPRPGNYFVLVVAEAKANITVTVEDCSKSNMTAGPGCKVPYLDSTSPGYLMNIWDAPKAWRYWRVIINENHTELWASVRSDSGLNLPSIYAAKGNLPTTDSYTIMNCNFEYCDGAHIIYMNFTDAKENPQVWYIGTFTDVANNTYGVWFDSVCAQECTEQNTGTCQDTYPDYGKCICATSSLTGVDCTIRNGLGPEYIVLIIIAALVVASAIIGFVAWAYMRRKRVQYEHVS